MGSQSHLHGEFDNFPIQDGEYARHAQAHGAGMGIRAGPEFGGTAAENLAFESKAEHVFPIR